MYDCVLVPTDGSQRAAAAVDHALAVAERFDATVHALYVVETDAIAHEAPKLPLDELGAVLRSRGERATGAVAERAADRGVDAVESLVEGVADRAIVDYAAEVDADLVVMGARGRDGPGVAGAGYPVGSVTQRVVRRAAVPVVVVRD
jgi:nucleotide-binding universal stress UspA family protein